MGKTVGKVVRGAKRGLAAASLAVSERVAKVQALPAQAALWNNTKNHARPALIGPLGTGKTRGLLLKDLLLRLHNWEHLRKTNKRARALPSMLVSPTFGMVRDVLIETVEEFLIDDLGLDVKIRNRDSRPDIIWPASCGGGRTMLRSGEHPQRLAGSNLSHVGFDEPGQMKYDAYKKAGARARHPKAICCQVFSCGSPEGINWFSEIYDDPKTEILGGIEIEHVTYWAREWHPLMSHYPAVLRAQFKHDPAQLDAYLRGLFVPMFTGRCYHQFDPDFHLEPDVAYSPHLPLILACDFNIDAMRWLICQTANEEIRVLDEIALGYGGNVKQACDEVVERYGFKTGRLHKHTGELVVCGDAAGQARSQAGTTNYALMRQELEPAFRAYSKRVPKENPFQRDRVDAVNYHLGGNGWEVLIHPQASELRKDLTQNHFRKGSSEIAKYADPPENQRTHAADALGYLIWIAARPSHIGRRRSRPTTPDIDYGGDVRSWDL